MRGRWVAGTVGALLCAAAIPSVASAAPDDLPPLACTQYLVDADGLHAVDLLTGHLDVVTEVEDLTAAGFSGADSLVYAWDAERGGVVAIGEGAHEFVGRVEGIDEVPWDGGDVDHENVLWLTASETGEWASIDLGSVRLVDTGSMDSAAGDWSLMADQSGQLHSFDGDRLLTFDLLSGIVSGRGGFEEVDSPVVASWADANKYLYLLLEDDRVIRIDVDSTQLLEAATLSVESPADGAWCPSAILEADWGNAPNSYGTSLRADGPRHALIDYDGLMQVAPLMLGERVGPSADVAHGYYGVNDAVGSSLAVSGEDPFVLDVIVTNDSDDAATLAVWLDADASGSFEGTPDATELIPARAGMETYQLEFPAPKESTWLRMRVAPGENAPDPVGAVRGGEVEDWQVAVEPRAAALALRGAVFEAPMLTVTVANTGNVALSPEVTAGELCVLSDGDTRLAPGTSAEFACAMEQPGESSHVLVTAVDGQTEADPLDIELSGADTDVLTALADAEESVPAEAEPESDRVNLIPFVIVIGGIGVLAIAAIAARRLNRDDGQE